MNLYKEKMQLVHKLKRFLEDSNFQEVLTPISRRDQGQLIPRFPFGQNYALRDSHELELRYLLSLYPCVYEIGSCFRIEDRKHDTNATEFLLMELFSSKHKLSDLMELTKQFLWQYRPEINFQVISIRDCIHRDLDIDLFHEPQEKLYAALKQRYSEKQFESNYRYVEHYIEERVHPLSEGRVVFFTEYPECTCSYADILQGNVISRFELFADKLELANGFDDECSVERFRKRNEAFPLFPREEAAVMQGLLDGSLPANSAGLGIGIERLCMFLFNSKQISDFMFPSDEF